MKKIFFWLSLFSKTIWFLNSVRLPMFIFVWREIKQGREQNDRANITDVKDTPTVCVSDIPQEQASGLIVYVCCDSSDGGRLWSELTHQWIWRRVLHSAVARRESVVMSVHFYCIFFQRNRIVCWSSVVTLRRCCGDVVCCSFLFRLQIEAEEYHSYGHHQGWESGPIISRLFYISSQ